MCFCNLNIGLILLYGIMELYGVYGVNNLNSMIPQQIARLFFVFCFFVICTLLQFYRFTITIRDSCRVSFGELN